MNNPTHENNKRFAYIERVVELDWGKPIDELVTLVTLAAGPCPAARERPFANFKRWKAAAVEILDAALPEATRATGMRYTMHLVVYMARAHFDRKRIDNYFHRSVIDQIRAARRKVRSE